MLVRDPAGLIVDTVRVSRVTLDNSNYLVWVFPDQAVPYRWPTSRHTIKP